MKYSKDLYIGFDPFDGDRDVSIRNKTVKLVKVRKPHECLGEREHTINNGEMARCESAIVDEKWASFYVCIPCMDKWIKEIYGDK